MTKQSKGSQFVQTLVLKPISRRKALSYLGVASASLTLSSIAFAGPDEVNARISAITNGAAGDDTLITLDLPEIAENGNAVKVAFDIDSPMTADNYVKAVHILADGNPEPDVATFNFSPHMGACYASTRMRLSKTQNVHVIAAFSDGSFGNASALVKVTIGGCGG
jgi:sulfur-oxidizing protein SoxY